MTEFYPIKYNGPKEPIRKATPKKRQYDYSIPILIILFTTILGGPFLYTANFLNCDTIKSAADKYGIDYSHVDFTNCVSDYHWIQIKVDLIIFSLYTIGIGLIVILKRSERRFNN